MTFDEIRAHIKTKWPDMPQSKALVIISDGTKIPMGSLTLAIYGHMRIDAERAQRLADFIGLELTDLAEMLGRDARFILQV